MNHDNSKCCSTCPDYFRNSDWLNAKARLNTVFRILNERLVIAICNGEITEARNLSWRMEGMYEALTEFYQMKKRFVEPNIASDWGITFLDVTIC